MNEDSLNMEIRRFLKKVGITSQREIEKEIYNAKKNGNLKIGEEIELEMTLNIKKFNSLNVIKGKITIE
tara:strand:+ start:220 stop:426 length:207 start_codon:yes stop_codon:yes gene_type:complete